MTIETIPYPTRAITLWPPWPQAIAFLDKRLENRGTGVVREIGAWRGLIGIAESKAWGIDQCARGLEAIELSGQAWPEDIEKTIEAWRGRMVLVVELLDVLTPDRCKGDPWHVAGQHGLILGRVEALGGCRAYLKPLRRPTHAGHVRAAREKIVSDLAHDLEVGVPPVLLYDRGVTPSGEEQHVCLSRVMFPRQFSWGLVKQKVVMSIADDPVTRALMSALRLDPARAFALNAWVGQPDHNDHPHNIVFGYSPGATPNGRFIFLDYAFSLGYAPEGPFCWYNDGWKRTVCPPFPPHMIRFMERTALLEMVERIEAMPDIQIEQIVSRIPPNFLPVDQRNVILSGLLGRKSLVRQIVRPYTSPS